MAAEKLVPFVSNVIRGVAKGDLNLNRREKTQGFASVGTIEQFYQRSYLRHVDQFKYQIVIMLTERSVPA